ncbi:MAG: PD40 domain-containing protein, partial [Phycisphaerales bacterium]|nr:PD40 domain-containing protein [Phycisphaerales bacterium]
SIFKAEVQRTRSELKEAIEQPEEEVAAEAEDAASEPAEDAEAEAADEGAEDMSGEGDEKKKDDKEEDEGDNPADRWHDALSFSVEPVVQTSWDDREPHPSPDGLSLAFMRNPGNIVILDLASGEERTLVEGWDRWATFAWSPDSRYIAYDYSDADYNSDIFVVPADGSAAAVNISMHPDNDNSPAWSQDGRVLAFISERINDEGDVWAVYLDTELDALPRRDLEAYYDERVKAAKKLKPLKPGAAGKAKDEDAEASETEAADDLDLADAYLRLRRITSERGSESDVRLTPAGDRFVYNASGGVYTVKWDGSDEKRLDARGDIQGLSLAGDQVLTVRGGEAWLAKVPGGDAERLSIDADILIDLQTQNREKFIEAARTVGQVFYDAGMKGLNWDAVTAGYLELAEQSRTAEEFRHVAARLIGELNASHLGIYPPGEPRPNSRPSGRLGIDVEAVSQSPAAGFAFERAYRVTRVIERGPAWGGTMALQAGDLITGIEFTPFGADDTLESALADRVNDETIVSVLRKSEAGEWEAVDVLLVPVSYGQEVTLRYDAWQRERARLVDEWSGGRIGYLHIRSMGAAALVEFERDLFAAANGKDGLLVDVR